MLAIITTIEKIDDRDKAEQLYKRYRSTMLHIAKTILHESALAEDAVSEAFIRIIKNLGKINEIDCYKTRGFIVIIIRNVSIDILRKRDITIPLDDYLEYSDNKERVFDDVATKEAYKRLASSIENLNHSYSDILYLKGIYGYSINEIADILGITKENVSVRLNRARNALKKQLRKEDESYE